MRCAGARKRLDPLLDGVLDPVQEAAVRAHVARCAACEAELARREALYRLLRQALAPVPTPPDLAAAVVARLPAVRNTAGVPWPEAGAPETGADLPLDVALSRAASALLAWTATGLGGAMLWLSVQAGGVREAVRLAVSAVPHHAARLAGAAVRLTGGDLVHALRETVRAWAAHPGAIAGPALEQIAAPFAWAEAHPETVLAAGLVALALGLAGLWRIHLVARQS